MQMKKLTNILIAAALAIAVCACAKEKQGQEPEGVSGEAQLHLRLKTSTGFAGPASRALTFTQENTLENIYVLVFDSAGNLKTIQQGTVTSTTPGSDDPRYSGEGTFTVTLESSSNSADTYNLVVLANSFYELAYTIGTSDISTIYLGNNYNDIVARIFSSISDKMYDNSSQNAIPMWGETGPIVIQPGNSSRSLELTRAVARIDVGVGKATRTDYIWSWDGLDALNGAIPFRLGHVYVMRPNNRYAVVPYPTVAAGSPSIPASTTAFEADVSEATFFYTATASGTGGFSSQDMYVPEADVLKTPDGKPGDANHIERMAIVVGGFYDGSPTETFYRLDFAVGGSLVNVLRNHLYQFSISGVTGPGFGDVQTAYSSQSMNMTVTINDWNATDMAEIFLDGTLWVMLGRSVNQPNDNREAVLFRPAGSSDSMEMRTNIPLDQFTLALDGGGALPDPTNPKVIQNDRFNVELRSDSTGIHFIFTALKAYEGTASDNPSTLTVTTGRIRFEIVIRQLDSDPGDWIDGGNIDREL